MARVRLPKWLSTLQKRTRDKEYRLRRKGVDAAEVAAVSPRLDAATVMGMSARQQRAYGERLAKFNSRDERFVVTGGSILSEQRYRQIERQARAQYNRMAALNRARIERAYAGTTLERYGTVAERAQVTSEIQLNGKRIGGVFVAGQVSPIRGMEPPASKAAAQRRAEMFKNLTAPGAAGRRRDRVRESVRKMLYLNGQTELADAVDDLSDTQFDVLTIVTDFMGLIKTEYGKNTYTGKQLGLTMEELRHEATAFGDYAAALDLVGEVASQVR